MAVIEPIMEAQKKVASMNSPPPFSSMLTQNRPSKSKQPVTRGQIWLLIRRVMVLVAAIVYINYSMNSALMSIKLLLGTIDTSIKLDPFNADYITSYAIPTNVREGGASTVAQGKLVNEILHGDLTPRVNQTLYLHSKTDASFDECPHYTTEATQRMYSDVFLRQIFSEVVRDTASGVPELVGNEMVIPIVDCSFTALRIGDRSVMRAFFLMRKSNSKKLSDSFLFVFSLGIQDYRFPEQYQVGATGVLVLSVVSDFNSPKINRYYCLSPGYPFREARFDLYTKKGLTEDGFLILENIKTADTYQVSRRVGIFRVAEAQQSIITNLHWDPPTSPELALSLWKRVGVSIRQDAWGWVGGIHFFFVAETCFNLLVLLIVIYRNKKKGKIWIGDAFVSISKATIIRALMVLVAWALNGFWSANKFMLEDGNIMGNVPLFFVYPSLLQGDVMMIYLGIVNLIGVVLCERIDPALSMLLFEIGFTNRQKLLRWFPVMADKVITIARHEFANGARAVDAKHLAITPLRMSSTHELTEVDATFAFCALFPIFFTLIVLVAYVPMRKIYRHYYPDRIVRASNVSGASSTGTRTASHASKASQSELSSVLTWKSTLTIFEVATGAALQSRVGLVSDYDNCIYIKGMKFASADGIFCNGFVVVQDKYLIRTGELWMMLLMVLTRVRFRDLYVYEVDGFTVQKMARLFYPDMLTLSDMLHLSTMVLA